MQSQLNARTAHTFSDIFVDNVHIELSLWDTAGQEEFDRLRSLSYDDTHTIMLCFSVGAQIGLSHRPTSDEITRSIQRTLLRTSNQNGWVK